MPATESPFTDIEMFKEVLFQVQVETNFGETVCICGNIPALGQWDVDGSICLTLTNPLQNIWSGSVSVPVGIEIEFRYIVAIVLDVPTDMNAIKKEIVVRKWETKPKPRSMVVSTDTSPLDLEVHVFGNYNGEYQVNNGWLRHESVVQMKLYDNPILIWKKRYADKKISVKISPIDLNRRESDAGFQSPPIDNEQDSNASDGGLGIVSKWPVIEYAVMNEGEYTFKPQTQFGHVFNKDDFVIFHAQMLKPETVAYMLDFYIHASPMNSTLPEHIGFCYILPTNLRGTSGTCTMPISGNKQQPIGQLTMEYLIVRPLQGYTCFCKKSFAHCWDSEKKGLDVGHRGAGNARRTDKVENVLENTVASFNYAASHGADMVELDVQLSKDMVPVIFHDYYIEIQMKKKKNANEHETLKVAIKDLTYDQLRALKINPIIGAHHKAHYEFEEDYDDNQPFPTLQQVLECVNPNVGVNIEIKCPMQLRDGTWEQDSHFDFNLYVDIILQCILKYGGTRYIILSCFHPDICTMVSLKQNRYPLLFLTQGQTEKYPPYLDTRTSTIQMAIYFALGIGLLGINVHAEELLRDFSVMQLAKSHRLIVFCWGEDIKSSQVIGRLKEQGVDGVIYDRVDEFSSSQEGIFTMDKKQCKAILQANGFEAMDSYASESSTNGSLTP